MSANSKNYLSTAAFAILPWIVYAAIALWNGGGSVNSALSKITEHDARLEKVEGKQEQLTREMTDRLGRIETGILGIKERLDREHR